MRMLSYKHWYFHLSDHNLIPRFYFLSIKLSLWYNLSLTLLQCQHFMVKYSSCIPYIMKSATITKMSCSFWWIIHQIRCNAVSIIKPSLFNDDLLCLILFVRMTPQWFPTNTHNRHSIRCHWGHGIWCLMWAHSLIYKEQVLLPSLTNSLWPSDTIWRQRSGSTLAQVMACCLTAPSHYLNQCWLIISEVQWQSYKGNFTRDASTINH